MAPILHREVCLQARQRLTPLLRVTGAALLMAACGWVTRRDPSGRLTSGLGVFIGLNKILLVTLWILGPVLTADCLSRERREGTLDLLFLTPLRARDLILGKAAGNSIRAFTVLFAALPVGVIPVLMGGVGWPDVIRMFLLHLAVLALALTAGVLASAVTREWWRAALLASGLACGAAAAFAGLYVAAWTWRGGWRVGPGARVATGDGFLGVWFQNLRWWLDRHLVPGTGPGWFWRNPAAGGATWESVLVAAGVLTAAVALATGAIALAAVALRRRWIREAAQSSGRVVPRGTEVAVAAGFRVRAGRLDRDPAGWWFTRRSPSWVVGAALAVLTVGAVAVSESGPTSLIPHEWIGRFLFLVAALGAVVAFRDERGGGGFELLLPTPVPAARWWWRRMRSLLAVWGPPVVAFAVAAGLADHQRYLRGDPAGRYFDPDWVVVGQYAVLPIHLLVVLSMGVRLGLRGRSLVVGWGGTVAATLGLRLLVLWGLQNRLLWPGGVPVHDWTGGILWALAGDLMVQAAFGIWAWRDAVRILRERRWDG